MFDGSMAIKGYGLNKMCYTLNGQAGRDEFKADEQAYCDKFGLTDAQKKAIAEGISHSMTSGHFPSKVSSN